MVNAVLTFLGMAVLGIFAWAFSLSNRVAVLEADRSSLKELFEAKFQELTRRLDSIDHKLG